MWLKLKPPFTNWGFLAAGHVGLKGIDLKSEGIWPLVLPMIGWWQSIRAAKDLIHTCCTTRNAIDPIVSTSKSSLQEWHVNGHILVVYPLVNWHRPWQIGVGRLVSIKNGWFSGSMLIYQGVIFQVPFSQICPLHKRKSAGMSILLFLSHSDIWGSL